MAEPRPERNEVADRLPLADRVHDYEAPRELIHAALTVDRRWLRLQPGEVEPRVLEASPSRVVWSSFWPVSPEDTIVFDISGSGSRCSVRFRWFSDSPPDDRGIGITRQRLNRKFGADIRSVVSDYYWSTRDP
jgi:hypothetical protein